MQGLAVSLEPEKEPEVEEMHDITDHKRDLYSEDFLIYLGISPQACIIPRPDPVRTFCFDFSCFECSFRFFSCLGSGQR